MAALLTMAAAASLGGCQQSQQEVVFPSPDGTVQLVHTTWFDSDIVSGVDLQGADEERVSVGGAPDWTVAAIGWTSGDSFNVCGLEAKSSSFVLRGYDGRVRTYHVTRNCPTEPRRGAPDGPGKP